MPKKDVEIVICDGCGAERSDVGKAKRDGMRYCYPCAKRRRGNPSVTVQGRTLTASELEAQAKKDKDLAAALEDQK